MEIQSTLVRMEYKKVCHVVAARFWCLLTEYYLQRYPETENHVLMTLSSLYLTNQWIYNNPRNDTRLTKRPFSKRVSFLNSASLENMLLQTMGRVVHSDYFETNARPYQAFTLHSMMNLYAFAESPILRAAAKNAIDFTATKFAFQSFEGKRLAPQRRQSDYRAKMSIYGNDPVVFVMGMLSGFYSWNDTIRITPDGKLDRMNYFPANYSGNGMGHMLWAALISDHNFMGDRRYQLPRAIHGFMLSKITGFWARMQARFSDVAYKGNRNPRYFRGDVPWMDNGFESTPELYYGTDRVFSVAGGRWNNYPLDDPGDDFVYDFTGKPSFIMPAGRVRDWGDAGTGLMAEDTLLMNSGSLDKTNNLGTYKGFSWGYSAGTPKGKTPPLYAEPFTVPTKWSISEDYLPTQGEHTIRFRFYEVTGMQHSFTPIGYYVITAGLKVQSPPKRYRGFYEVVPNNRFLSIQDLRAHVLASNNGDTFSEKRKTFAYNSTTGEIIELYKDAGETNIGGIAGIIWPHNNIRLSLKDYHIDTAARGINMPLIDVNQLDHNGLQTGLQYVWSPGDGMIQIKNPFVDFNSSRLCIDSSNYREPRQTTYCYWPGAS